MPLKSLIQGIAALWLVLFVISFIALQSAETEGGSQSALARVVVFLTWQVVAFVVAIIGAFTTRYALSRGVERIRAVGYVPLALSVFLVASFIVLMGFRVFVLPLFE